MLGWGLSAALGLAAVAVLSQTQTGSERLVLAISGALNPVVAATPDSAEIAQVAAVPRDAEPDAETQHLAEQLRELTLDRDRLAARLASLERQLDDVTGSIGRQRAAAAPVTAPAAQPPASVPEPRAPEPESAAAEPLASTPFEVAPDLSPKIAAIAPPLGQPPHTIDPLAMPAAEEIPASWSEPANQAEAAPTKVVVPMPPVRVAAVATARRTAPPPRPAFGVDIGGSLSTHSLAGRWAEVKASYGPLFNGMHPAILRDHQFGHAPFRLLIGPLPNVIAAARLCAQLTVGGFDCRPVQFDDRQLARF